MGHLRALGFLALTGSLLAQSPSVRCEKLADRVDVTVNDQRFTSYRFGQTRRPCLWPVIGPGDVTVTRSWPLGPVAPGERKDHPHHTGIWLGHGNVNGVDFWHPQSKKHGGSVRVLRWLSDPAKTSRIHVRHQWSGPDDKPVAEDETTLAFGADEDRRWVDWTVQVFASHGPLRFGDTKEGSLGIRMHPALRLKGAVATGSVVNAAGVSGKAVWGKRASWIDYSGTIDGKAVGVAMMDHPRNPRHPTWWHARDYGLCAANPFGTRAFEGREQAAGTLEIPGGGSVTFRWRVLIHRGDAEKADIPGRFKDFSATASGSSR